MSKAISKTAAAPLTLVDPTDDQNAQMGAQLTAQYEKATGAMKEVLIFGCMMLQLREMHPEMTQAGRPKKELSTVDNKAPVTLQKWLDKFAPKVKRPTAMRFLHVAESVAEQYAEIVGAKVAAKFSLPALVTASELPGPVSAKRDSLFDFIAGTSQRSWLDQFAPPAEVGGTTYTRTPDKGKGKRKTAAQLKAEAEAELNNALNALDAFFVAAHHTRVPKDRRVTAAAVLAEAKTKLESVAD